MNIQALERWMWYFGKLTHMRRGPYVKPQWSARNGKNAYWLIEG